MEEIKNNEDKNIQRLREEFNQRQKQNENHPKTSHGIKHSINEYINNNQYNHSKKYKSYNKALSANKYKQNIKSNHFFYKNNFPISKNHPGYLYYKEIMKYTKRNKKRNFTGKAINRNYKLEPIKSQNKNNYEGYHRYNDKFPKINGDKNSMNERRTYYNNNKNNKYFPFWVDKKQYNKNDFIFDIKGISYGGKQLNNTINKKNELALKILNKNKENNSKKMCLDNYNNDNNQKNVYYNNFMNKEVNKLAKGKKVKEKTNKKNNINNNNLNDDNEKKVFNNIFNLNEKDKPDNIKNEQNKEEIINNDLDEDIDEEKEKMFYTNQKNFFKARKDIIEEPEYLEEDNENEIK